MCHDKTGPEKKLDQVSFMLIEYRVQHRISILRFVIKSFLITTSNTIQRKRQYDQWKSVNTPEIASTNQICLLEYVFTSQASQDCQYVQKNKIINNSNNTNNYNYYDENNRLLRDIIVINSWQIIIVLIVDKLLLLLCSYRL